MTNAYFPYDVDRKWTAMFLSLRLRGDDGVTLTSNGTFRATFGWFMVETPISNIDHTDISGPHRWYTAVGARLSFADDGLTFGTNHRRGLCLGFVDKIPKVIGTKDHSALWVSVADPEGLAAAIEDRQ